MGEIHPFTIVKYMNAEEVKQLSLQIKYKLITERELIWLALSDIIFQQIKSDVILENTKTVIDLKNDEYSRIDNLEFLKDKLETKGYKITFLIEKQLGGKKEMIIEW